MKKFFTFIGLLAFAAGYTQDNTIRTFVVVYEKQANRDSLWAYFRANRIDADSRSRITLNALREASSTSGKKVENYLDNRKLEKSLTGISYRKMWIVNGLELHAPSWVAEEVALIDEVAYVEDLSAMKIKPILPVAMEESVGRSVNGVEPGLVAVGARYLWDLGYTGKAMKAMSFDTGIWPDHPAIGGRFHGEYLPRELSWGTVFSPVPADKGNSHGTHTIGTMGGLDKANNDTIGLAFNAYFMATDPIVPNLADTIGTLNIMAVYEWVLDPDGDPNTTDDMPHVICNSWGVSTSGYACVGFIADMLDAIELTGIANEYSAGNDGPSIGTIGIPALVPRTEVNAFAVGAINGSDPSFPIASFSSRGPTPCPVTGALQIKPEVVAPGVGVRSCVKQNEYAAYNGTSMAGPHVAGLLLLLKEAFPSLPGETLKEALYYSAIDLGTPGEDDTYGMGIVNGKAAYEWLLNEGYTPVPPVSSYPELALEKAPKALFSASCEGEVPNKAYLFNEGMVAINDTVLFKVNLNGILVGEWKTKVVLAPGQRLEVDIPFTAEAALGENELWISAHQKSNLVEKDLINNNRTVHFVRGEAKTIPYYQNFETDGFSSIGWDLINPDYGKTFELYATAGQQSGTTSAAMRFLENSKTDDVDYLVSPPIRLDNSGNHFVAFDIAYRKRTNIIQKDTLSLVASLDCGKTFSEVIFEGKADDLVSHAANSPINYTPSEEGHWKRLMFPVPSVWNGETVLFAFRSVNQRGTNAYIDDFSVFKGFDALAVDENEALAVSVFPNPFTDIVSVVLDKSAKNIRAEVFDMGGRLIHALDAENKQQVTMDLGGALSSGVYFLKVMANGVPSVHKIVKQ